MRWPIVHLGALCSFLNGGTPSKSVERYFQGEIPWITGADITSPIVNAARSFITEEAVQNSATNFVPAGTVLLVTRTSVGKVAIAGVPLCFSQDITAITPNTDRLNSNYLVHFLKSQEPHFKQNQRGATIQGITRDVVAELKIPLPPLAEQQRIAAILDKADALRQKRRQSLAKLDTLLQSVFLEMFGDPVTNPKGWDVGIFSEVGTLDRGKSKHRPRNAPELLGGTYPLIQTGDIANANGYIRKYEQTYSEIGLRQSKMWKAGTLCITIAANIAKTAILTFDACFPDSVVGFTPNSRVTTEFVQQWLSFLQKTLEDSAPESAQKNINLKILRELSIPLPPKLLQEKFSTIVGGIESLKAKKRAAEAEGERLFQSLQQCAFTGELFVAEARAAVQQELFGDGE
jgi:type I restriction enzyme S subunit